MLTPETQFQSWMSRHRDVRGLQEENWKSTRARMTNLCEWRKLKQSRKRFLDPYLSCASQNVRRSETFIPVILRISKGLNVLTSKGQFLQYFRSLHLCLLYSSLWVPVWGRGCNKYLISFVFVHVFVLTWVFSFRLSNYVNFAQFLRCGFLVHSCIQLESFVDVITFRLLNLEVVRVRVPCESVNMRDTVEICTIC